MPTFNDLLPQASVWQAINIENEHIAHFRTWALRLRPFDSGLSRLLDLQVEEMDDHRRTLLDLTAASLPDNRGRTAVPVQGHSPFTAHFFVLDGRDAAVILHKARSLKEKALRCYSEFALTEPTGSTLGGVFSSLQRSKDAHLQILQEAQAGYALQHP